MSSIPEDLLVDLEEWELISNSSTTPLTEELSEDSFIAIDPSDVILGALPTSSGAIAESSPQSSEVSAMPANTPAIRPSNEPQSFSPSQSTQDKTSVSLTINSSISADVKNFPNYSKSPTNSNPRSRKSTSKPPNSKSCDQYKQSEDDTTSVVLTTNSSISSDVTDTSNSSRSSANSKSILSKAAYKLPIPTPYDPFKQSQRDDLIAKPVLNEPLCLLPPDLIPQRVYAQGVNILNADDGELPSTLPPRVFPFSTCPHLSPTVWPSKQHEFHQETPDFCSSFYGNINPSIESNAKDGAKTGPSSISNPSRVRRRCRSRLSSLRNSIRNGQLPLPPLISAGGGHLFSSYTEFSHPLLMNPPLSANVHENSELPCEKNGGNCIRSQINWPRWYKPSNQTSTSAEDKSGESDILGMASTMSASPNRSRLNCVERQHTATSSLNSQF